MEKNAFFGELLYIGFVIEKCRCRSSGFWKRRYNKTLITHLRILKKLAERLNHVSISSQDYGVLQEFTEVCKNNPNIGKYYNFSPCISTKIQESDDTLLSYVDYSSDNQINKLIIDLIDDALFYLNEKIFINKKRIYYLIRSLHNLPLYYVKENQSLIGSCRTPTSKKVALESSFSIVNMDDETRIKYAHLLNCIDED